MSRRHAYHYPGTDVLINKLDIRDAEALERAERRLVTARIREGCPAGNFDLAHLRAIHHHLFQDVYGWAGELRAVSMIEEKSIYLAPDRIEMGVRYLHSRVVEAGFLRGLDARKFSAKAAEIILDINHAHPFREGSGRTQLQYLKLLGEQAGHNVDLASIHGEAWIEATICAYRAGYRLMKGQIFDAIVPTLTKTQLSPNGIAQGVAPLEEELRLRKALNERQESEVEKLLQTHKAELAEAAGRLDRKAIDEIIKRQGSERLEQDRRHDGEFDRFIQECEDARLLTERLEEQRRADELSHEKEPPERGR